MNRQRLAAVLSVAALSLVLVAPVSARRIAVYRSDMLERQIRHQAESVRRCTERPVEVAVTLSPRRGRLSQPLRQASLRVTATVQPPGRAAIERCVQRAIRRGFRADVGNRYYAIPQPIDVQITFNQPESD